LYSLLISFFTPQFRYGFFGAALAGFAAFLSAAAGAGGFFSVSLLRFSGVM
jgi:hypothetical protein